MAGQREQREIERAETQRYSLAFIITILPRAKRGSVRERWRGEKIDGKKRQITGELQRKKKEKETVICVSFGLEKHCSLPITFASVCMCVYTP